MVLRDAQKYLGIGADNFKKLVINRGIRHEKVNNKTIYNTEDLDKIKAELEERKRIAQPPVYKQFKRPDWKPEPRELYYSLEDIQKILDSVTKSHVVNLINGSDYKFKKFFTKINKIYYLKKEIDENFNEIIKKLSKQSKLLKRINGKKGNTSIER
jgi:hypothetical protein